MRKEETEEELSFVSSALQKGGSRVALFCFLDPNLFTESRGRQVEIPPTPPPLVLNPSD